MIMDALAGLCQKFDTGFDVMVDGIAYVLKHLFLPKHKRVLHCLHCQAMHPEWIRDGDHGKRTVW